MKRLLLGVSILVVPPILACGGGDPAPAVPAPVVAPVAPVATVAPVEPAAPDAFTPRPPPWDGFAATEPFATLTSRCVAFGADGSISSYQDSAAMFVSKVAGTWTRDGDRIAMAWTTTTSAKIDAPEGTPEDEVDEDGTMWTESDSKASVTLRLLAAWEAGTADEGEAVILATAVDPTCAECRTVIWCTGYADHSGGTNGDAWFGPADPADVWAQVVDAGGGAGAVAEVGVLAGRDVAFVFPGDPARTPRTGIEVLHQEGPRATEAAAKIAATLGVLSTNVRAVPWAEAPHPVVIAVGPPDRWTPDLVAVEVVSSKVSLDCPTAALRGDPGLLYFRPADLPATCTGTSEGATVTVAVSHGGKLRCGVSPSSGLWCKEPS